MESESSEEYTEVIDANKRSESSSSSGSSNYNSESFSDEGSESPDPELRDFALIKMINKGGFGKVFLAKNVINGKYYAMKRIRKDLLI